MDETTDRRPGRRSAEDAADSAPPSDATRKLEPEEVGASTPRWVPGPQPPAMPGYALLQRLGAGGMAHDVEGLAEHGRILAEPQRLRHGDAGLPDGLQDPELLRPGQADGHRGGRIGAQHEALSPGPGPPVEAGLEQAVFLDRAAA